MNTLRNLSEHDLRDLEELIQSFACSLNIEETLSVALRKIMHYMKTEAASIFLLDSKSRQLICKASAGPVDLTNLRINIGVGIVGKTVARDEIQLIRDVSKSETFYAGVDKLTGFTTRSILCVPLKVQNTVLGAIEIINRVPGPDNPAGLFSDDDCHLLGILASAAALAIHNAHLAEELVRSKVIQQELEIARSIQESFLPAYEDKHPIMGINFAARDVSGDFFDYLQLPNGRYIFNIGDVSGKGLNAALLMAKASSLYHCLAKQEEQPAAILKTLNQEIFEHASRGMFVTMIGGLFDPVTREVTLANAGHPPAIQRQHDGSFKFHNFGGLPLGIMPDQEYQQLTFSLADSDLYLYTDGLSEGLARNNKNIDEMDGLKSLINRFNGEPRQQRLQLFADEVFMHDASFDDLTILLIEDSGQEQATAH